VSKTKLPITTITGLYLNSNFIYKHRVALA
jgi:hypothetical protein